eukprot:Nk52_evm2s239 gene=Nk52_evmTU2s239
MKFIIAICLAFCVLVASFNLLEAAPTQKTKKMQRVKLTPKKKTSNYMMINRFNQFAQTSEEDVPMETDIGFQYEASVVVGNSQEDQAIVVYDTGSSDLWVKSSASSLNGYTKAGVEGVNLNKPFEVVYGSGSVQGSVVSGDVSIGKFEVDAAPYGVASSYAHMTGIDGIFGLAFHKISNIAGTLLHNFPNNVGSEFQTKTVFDGLTEKNNAQNSVGFYMTTGKDSEMTIGDFDPSHFTGDELTYIDVELAYGYWSFGASITSGKVQTSTSHTISDTGTSLILIDNSAFESFVEQMKDASLDQTFQLHGVECADDYNDKYDDLTINIGEHSFTLTPNQYISEPIADKYGNNHCLILVSGKGSNQDIPNILGDTFIRAYYQYYIKYDDGTAQIGMAPRANQ